MSESEQIEEWILTNHSTLAAEAKVARKCPVCFLLDKIREGAWRAKTQEAQSL